MSGPIQAAGAPLGPIPADIPVPAPLTEVTVTRLPERLQQLARTVQIAGQVVAQEDGTATVRTAVGDVVVRTPVPLPTDRPVVLQIAPPPQPNAAPPPALVLLLGSPTPAAAPAGTPAAGAPTVGTPTLATPTVVAPTPSGVATLPTLQPGAVVTATVIQAAVPRPADASGAAPTATVPAGVTPAPAPTGATPALATASAVPALPAAQTAPALAATANAPPAPAVPASPTAAAPPAAAPPNTSAGTATAPVAAPSPGDDAPAPAAATPRVWAGLPPLARSIPLTSPTPLDNALPPQLAAAAALAGTPATEAAEPQPSVATPRPTAPASPTASSTPATTPTPSVPPPGAPAPSAPTATATPATPAPPGPQTAPQIAMIALGALPEEAVAAPAAPAQAQMTTAPTVPTATAAAAAAPALLRQGATLQVTVLAVGPDALAEAEAAPTPPPAGTEGKPTAPAAAPLAGRLEGTTSRGQPVVTTPAGTLLLAARTELPAGTPIRMEAAALPEIAAGNEAADVPPIDPLQGRTWPALKEVLATLTTVDPRLAHSVAQHVLPQPTPKLTTSLLAFLGALRGGNAAGWLGDAATGALERAGRGDLVSRLSDDFRALGLQGQERLVGDWRALTVPFGQMGDVRAFQFAVRQPDPDETGAAPTSRTARRFLIDVEFTRLGALQLDGLTSTGRFDLVVRSLQLLPGDLKRDLLAIFSGSLQAVGFTGQLAFQTGTQQWVKLTPAKRRGSASG